MQDYYYIFTEEESMKQFLGNLTLFKDYQDEVKFICFQGKQDLIKSVADRISGLEKWNGSDRNVLLRYIILIDQDREDCKQLKEKLLKRLVRYKLFSRDYTLKQRLLVRIVCRELESWYLGDLSAVQKAYPKRNLNRLRKYKRTPDIFGKPSLLFKRILQKESKVSMAEKIALQIDLESNYSHSFQSFIEGWRGLIAR